MQKLNEMFPNFNFDNMTKTVSVFVLRTLAFEKEFSTALPHSSFYKAISIRICKKCC